jgi:hypothetical protein
VTFGMESVPRKENRVAVDATVALRRAGHNCFAVKIFDMSPSGCKLEFVERPKLDERVWVKVNGMEALEGLVCWTVGFNAGIEFERPIHPAVFDMLVKRITPG